MQNRAPDSLPQARARRRKMRRFDEQASKLVVEPAFYLRWSIRDVLRLLCPSSYQCQGREGGGGSTPEIAVAGPREKRKREKHNNTNVPLAIH